MQDTIACARTRPKGWNAIARPSAHATIGCLVYESDAHTCQACKIGCALFYKPIWQLTVNERGHYADSEDTFLFKIEDSPDTRLGA